MKPHCSNVRCVIASTRVGVQRPGSSRLRHATGERSHHWNCTVTAALALHDDRPVAVARPRHMAGECVSASIRSLIARQTLAGACADEFNSAEEDSDLPKAANFDLDGTLIDSVDLHALAWHEAM